MNLSEWTTLLGAAAVLLVCVTAVYGAWRSLFRDRPAGRRRCPRCWHDLTHTPGLTCSECGRTARHESDLLRTRRHWPLALLSFGVCVTAVGWSYWTLADRGWRSLVPSRALIVALPVIGAEGPLYTELEQRAARNRLTPAQWDAMLRRAAAGDWWTTPPEDDWIEKYGSLVAIGRWRFRATTELDLDDTMRARLLAIPPRVDLRARRDWPIDSAPRIHVNLRDWWPEGEASRLRLTPDAGRLSTDTIYRTNERIPWAGFPITLEALDATTEQVTFSIVVDRRTEDDDWAPVDRTTVTLPFRFVEFDELDLLAVDDTVLTEAVWQTFQGGAVRWESGDGPVRFFFNGPPTQAPELKGLAVGVHVDVVKDERIARRLDIWWLAGVTGDDRGIGWESHDLDPELLAGIGEGDDWMMRVTSEPTLALRAGDANGYWEGDIAFPLRLRTRGGDAPERFWWTGDGDDDRDDDDGE